MNVHERNEVRELTAAELDEVTGGVGPVGAAVIFCIGATIVIGGIIGATAYGSTLEGDPVADVPDLSGVLSGSASPEVPR